MFGIQLNRPKVRFGDKENYSIFESDGKLHFVGNARPVKFYPIHSTLCEPSHHNPFCLCVFGCK